MTTLRSNNRPSPKTLETAFARHAPDVAGVGLAEAPGRSPDKGRANAPADALTVDAAAAFLRTRAVAVAQTVRLPLMEALGRVLSADVVAPIDVPAHDNSAMDGYAFDGSLLARVAPFDASDPSGLLTDDARNGVLEVAGIALAGHPIVGRIAPGTCARVMTGALIPEGTDTVIPHEFVRVLEHRDGRPTRVALPRTGFAQGANRRLRGEDLAKGQAVLRAGRVLRASDLGLLASLGIAEVDVRRRLRVAYFSTGDELRSIGEPLEPGCVYDSNRYTLHAMLRRLDIEPIDFGVVRDRPEALENALREAATCADVIVSSGGVSAGDADFVREIFARMGDVLFWKLAMRPGRPFAYGELFGDAAGTGNTAEARIVPFFGLPGNPVAVMATFYHLVRDVLLLMSGATLTPPLRVTAYAAAPIRKRPGRTEFARGIASRVGPAGSTGSERAAVQPGAWQVTLTGAQGSGVLSSMSEANCFVMLEHERADVGAGEPVDIMFFEGLI